MFNHHVVVIKREYINPCNVCEHPHACDECPEAPDGQTPVMMKPHYVEGKLFVGSGEDVYA